MVKVIQPRSLVIKVSVPRSQPIGVALDGVPKGERAGILLLYANHGWIQAQQRSRANPTADSGAQDGPPPRERSHPLAQTPDSGGPSVITTELLREVMNITPPTA